VPDRDAHLRSADFFDAQRHPQITFRGTRIENPPTKEGDRFRLAGELSIHGIGLEVTLCEYLGRGTDPWGKTRAGFNFRTEIDRQDWGLKWNQAIETGGVLSPTKFASMGSCSSSATAISGHSLRTSRGVATIRSDALDGAHMVACFGDDSDERLDSAGSSVEDEVLRRVVMGDRQRGLARFKSAQADPAAGFDVALRELEAGRKSTHWIWYIFPQLAGLGSSPMAVRYAIRDLDEAAAYLRDPLLRSRLIGMTHALASHLTRRPAPRLERLMGSYVDARKVVSSLTLFGAVSLRLYAAEPLEDYVRLASDAERVLSAASDQGIPPCDTTEKAIGDR
jgi:uncharacterized protein (DUF1810 family)